MACAVTGGAESVKALLSRGALPNAQDELGNTAVLVASMKGNLDAVLALLDARADVNLPRKVSRIVELSCLCHLHSASPLVLRSPVRQTGHTPLMVAAMNNHTDVMTLLVSRGAYLEAKNLVRGCAGHYPPISLDTMLRWGCRFP